MIAVLIVGVLCVLLALCAVMWWSTQRALDEALQGRALEAQAHERTRMFLERAREELMFSRTQIRQVGINPDQVAQQRRQ